MIFPSDLKETVILALSDNLKDMKGVDIFSKTSENDLIRYHMGLGMMLRNHYKLWEKKKLEKYINPDDYTEYFMYSNADDLSFEFIKEAQRLINE